MLTSLGTTARNAGAAKGLGKGISHILRRGQALRSNHSKRGQLAGVVVLDGDVFVGLVINRVEHHRHDTRAVHVDGDGHQVSSELEVLEEVHQPLSLLGGSEQSGILGVVGARGHEGVQLGQPRENSVVQAEDVGDGAAPSVRAVGMRRVAEAMETRDTGRVSKVKDKTFLLGALQIAQQMFEHLEVGVARVGHELAQLVDHEGNVGASPAGEVVREGHEAGILGRPWRRLGRAIILGEDSACGAGSLRGVAVLHLYWMSMPKK